MKRLFLCFVIIGILLLFQFVLLWRRTIDDNEATSSLLDNTFGMFPHQQPKDERLQHSAKRDSSSSSVVVVLDFKNQSIQQQQQQQQQQKNEGEASSFSTNNSKQEQIRSNDDDDDNNNTTNSSIDDIDDDNNDENICGLWLAKSTIPGAGMGMFAGRHYEKDEFMLEGGDLALPVIDMNYQNKIFNSKYHHNLDFLWVEYVWNSLALGMEDIAKQVSVASTGFGAAPNCILDLINVKEGEPQYTEMGLQVGMDPGAGAFSSYHGRNAQAKGIISTGDELFVDYDDHWFESRQYYMGYVPLTGDYKRADKIIKKFKRVFGDVVSIQDAKNNATTDDVQRRQELIKDAYEMFLAPNGSMPQRSTILAALPKTWDEFDEHMKRRKTDGHKLYDYHHSKHSVSMEWLEEHGSCADHLRVAPSSVSKQAGHGAFAKRNLRKGSVVAPVPMIHISNRSIFAICDVDYRGHKNNDDKERIESIQKRLSSSNYTIDDCPQQLLMNYCMGHDESTLLLCPYGVQTSYINHGSSSLANVKWQWANSTLHDSSWLNLTINELHQKEVARLSMELIAIRDIHKDEEILVDYGIEWEQAWDEHVVKYEQSDMKLQHLSSAEMLNQDKETSLIKMASTTSLSNSTNSLSHHHDNIALCISTFYTRKIKWYEMFVQGTLREFVEEKEDNGWATWRYCNQLTVLEYDHDPTTNRTLFTIIRKEEDNNDDEDDYSDDEVDYSDDNGDESKSKHKKQKYKKKISTTAVSNTTNITTSGKSSQSMKVMALPNLEGKEEPRRREDGRKIKGESKDDEQQQEEGRRRRRRRLTGTGNNSNVGNKTTSRKVMKKKSPSSKQLARFVGVPSDLLHFVDKPYTMTMFHPSAFRHDMRIPDELFPDIWKNKKKRPSS